MEINLFVVVQLLERQLHLLLLHRRMKFPVPMRFLHLPLPGIRHIHRTLLQRQRRWGPLTAFLVHPKGLRHLLLLALIRKIWTTFVLQLQQVLMHCRETLLLFVYHTPIILVSFREFSCLSVYLSKLLPQGRLSTFRFSAHVLFSLWLSSSFTLL